MTHSDPERSSVDELRYALRALQICEAIVVAMSDAHGTLDAMLNSSDGDRACRTLQERFDFTELQATAVMDMQFRRVTATDRATIEERRQDLAARVKALQAEVGGS